MFGSFRRSLALRTGIAIALLALLLSAALSAYVYLKSYNKELANTDSRLGNLVEALASSAAIAAHLDDQVLAREIVEGISRTDAIAGVVLSSKSGTISKGQAQQSSHLRPLSFTLSSPIMENEKVGEITVYIDRTFIERNARTIAWDNITSLVALALALIAVAILTVHHQLIKPLRQLAQGLHSVTPGEATLLRPLQWHKENQIGQLVDDINHLIESVAHSFDEERALRSRIASLADRFRLIFESASSGIALLEPDGQVRMCNSAFTQLLGGHFSATPDGDPGSYFPGRFSANKEIHRAMNEALQGRKAELDLQLKNPGGVSIKWLHALFSSVQESPSSQLVECIVYDITERTNREQAALIKADRDPLTGLMNRRACEQRIAALLAHGPNRTGFLGLMLIDLDGFKPINDNIVHQAGDMVLNEVAARLQSSVRSNDLAVRWGGDEFVVVVLSGLNGSNIHHLAERILERLSENITREDGNVVNVGASIGIALYPDHADSFDELVMLADQVMYEVKRAGGNACKVHSTG
ncbi:MAG: diguanylate cyclase, partial [Parahaliea sp.]